MQSDYRGITMNNYQSYKDYKNSGRRTAGPREGSSPEVKRKPVKKTKASVISKARPSKKDTAAAKRIEAQKKKAAAQERKNLKLARRLERKEKSEQRRHAIKSNRKPLMIACFVVFYIAISMVILYNNSRIAQMQYSVNEIRKEIEKEKNYQNELEAERESTFKSETIENYAKYRLNMVYPSKEQTVYIKID